MIDGGRVHTVVAMTTPEQHPHREPFVRRAVMQTSTSRAVQWGIAVESPVEIALNGAPWTVMLATPSDVSDLAIGVALTEGILRSAQAVSDVIVSEFLQDISVNLVVPEAALDLTALRSRSLLSSTACGLCGLESLAQLQSRAAPERTQGIRDVDDANIVRAFDALASHQPLNRATRSVHAAAWCALDGSIALVREDVGRHNALDKLVGAMATRDMLSDDGFIIMSSRCSYELVYKASATNTRLLATISAPTTMALDWSAALSLPIVCCATGSEIVRFPLSTTEQSHV